MDWWGTASAVGLVLGEVIERVEEGIDSVEAMRQVPWFLAIGIGGTVSEMMLPVAMPGDQRRDLQQQNWRDIPRIAKDCLMPKDVGKDSPSDDGNSSPKTSLNLKQFSSKSRKSLLSEPRGLKTLSLTERRSNKNSKKVDTRLEQLKAEQVQEDPEIVKLRERNEIRLKYDSDYVRLSMAREKSFHEKSQFLSEMNEGEPNASITHDYEGEQLKSLIADERIKHYMMRAEFGPLAKKHKEGGLHPEVSVVEVSRNHREKQGANRTVKAMQMPLFPVQPRDLATLHEVKNYKLHDYRKHFARKYSRLDNQYNQTLDLSSKDKEQHRDEIFSERRHLRDSSSVLEGSRESAVLSHHPPRRLALPRLHGRYKVLDRYQQI